MEANHPPADTRRVPGWERVLNAFMADPDRIRTNVELGQIPGVQAFHQRLSDLIRYGYIVTSAVKLGGNGRYAYALVGYEPHEHRWPFRRPRPYQDRLPVVIDADDTDRLLEAAAVKIDAKADELTSRNAPAPTLGELDAEALLLAISLERTVHAHAVRTLQEALPEDTLQDLDMTGLRGQLEALAEAARAELLRLRAEPDPAQHVTATGPGRAR